MAIKNSACRHEAGTPTDVSKCKRRKKKEKHDKHKQIERSEVKKNEAGGGRCLEHGLLDVGRRDFEHLHGHDAEGPHVDLARVVLALDQLGRHPEGGAHH